jgi:hypothetical protein
MCRRSRMGRSLWWSTASVAWLALLAPLTAAGARPATSTVTSVRVDAASPAQGRINEQLVGFDAIGAGSSGLLQQLGTRWARQDVGFQNSVNGQAVYDCSGPWNPAYTDEVVQQAKAAGADPLLDIDFTPQCLASSGPPGHNWWATPPDIGQHDAVLWRHLVKQMAMHEIAAEGVRTFEVWNEPESTSRTFWTGGLSGYEVLYKNTVGPLEQAARLEHTSIEVGGPALTDINLGWFNRFVRFVKRHRLPLDFVTWHLYADQPSVSLAEQANFYGATTDIFRGDLANYHLHPLLGIDEWNLDSQPVASLNSSTDAAFVAASLTSDQQARLNFSDFFSAQDFSPSENWGVLAAGSSPGTLVPKPDYYAFSFWHELAGRIVHSRVLPAPSGNDVGAEASRSAGGVVHVMVYDFAQQASDQRLSVVVTGLKSPSYQVNEVLVDPSHTDTQRSFATASGPRVKVPLRFAGAGTALVTLTPTGS